MHNRWQWLDGKQRLPVDLVNFSPERGHLLAHPADLFGRFTPRPEVEGRYPVGGSVVAFGQDQEFTDTSDLREGERTGTQEGAPVSLVAVWKCSCDWRTLLHIETFRRKMVLGEPPSASYGDWAWKPRIALYCAFTCILHLRNLAIPAHVPRSFPSEMTGTVPGQYPETFAPPP